MGQESIGRRDMIRRAAIVGGLAWSAPIIVESIASPAGALTQDPPPDTTTTTSAPTVPTTAPLAPPIEPGPVGSPDAVQSTPDFVG